MKEGDRKDPGGHDCPWEALRDPNRSGCGVERGVRRKERWMTGLGVLPGEQWFWGAGAVPGCLLARGWGHGAETHIQPL